jgi:hypothetical protein
METVPHNRSASLFIRVWSESGTDDFRARLTALDTSPGEVGDAEVTVGVASSPAAVMSMVRTWLSAFLDPGSDVSPDGP